MGSNDSESKVEIIKVSSTSPLAFYSLIIVTLTSLVAALNWVETPENRQLIIVGIFLVILTMIGFVGFSMFSKKRGKNMEFPGHGSALGDLAIKGFFEGGNTNQLRGRWEVSWLERDETGEVKPYTVKEENTGEETPYPNDIVSVKVNGAMVSAEAHDQTTRRVYYLEGRLSTRDTVTLLYWSRAGVAEAMLVGVLFLRVKKAFDKITMEGQWIGHDRNDHVVTGEVIWKKQTID